MKRVLLTIILLSIFSAINAQEAEKLFKSGEEKIEKSDFKTAAKLLSKAVKAESDNLIYKYELSYAYYRLEKFKKAFKIIDPVLKSNPDIVDTRKFLDLLYKEMGISFDYKEKEVPKPEPVTALDFANLAKEFLEKGDAMKAIENYDHAIDLEPLNPEYYYQAAKLYSVTVEKIWAIIYSEIFINLERNTDRTEEMKTLLAESYKRAITINSPSNISINVSEKKAEYNLKDFNPNDFKVNFQQSYSTTMELGLSNLSDGFSIINLYKLRKDFINYWCRGKEKEFPSFIFDYMKKMLDENQFEGYNYWLFKSVYPNEFNEWNKYFSKQVTAYEEWIKLNPIQATNYTRINPVKYK